MYVLEIKEGDAFCVVIGVFFQLKITIPFTLNSYFVTLVFCFFCFKQIKINNKNSTTYNT